MKNQDTPTGEKIDFPKELLEQARSDEPEGNIEKNNNNEDPVTLADLKVNDLIINRINKKYKEITWKILSEENVKIGSEKC